MMQTEPISKITNEKKDKALFAYWNKDCSKVFDISLKDISRQSLQNELVLRNRNIAYK